MQTIKEDIKNNQYKPAYLLYGAEDYLKKLYQDKLKAGILYGTDDMNYACFEGKGIDAGKVLESAGTLPFFSDRRLILIKDSGFFKSQNGLSDHIRDLPDTTVLVFVESEVDKRNKLYKAVKEIGHICEMNGMDERNLKIWISSLLKKEGKKMTEKTIQHLLHRSGSDMKCLSNEVEKLVCYAYDREIITADDVDAVSTVQVTGKIFQMIDVIASHKQEEAMSLYEDLLVLREKPMSILFLLTRHFNILLQIKELSNSGLSSKEVAAKVSVPPFAVNKYGAQAKSFTKQRLVEILEHCVEVEEQIKTGRLLDSMGIELLIVRFSSMAA